MLCSSFMLPVDVGPDIVASSRQVLWLLPLVVWMKKKNKFALYVAAIFEMGMSYLLICLYRTSCWSADGCFQLLEWNLGDSFQDWCCLARFACTLVLCWKRKLRWMHCICISFSLWDWSLYCAHLYASYFLNCLWCSFVILYLVLCWS